MKRVGLALVVALMAASGARAEPTRVVVRAQAVDAKFIGDQMGGVQVTLRDARSRRVLARGLIRGGTGDTARIMKTPRSRGQVTADAATAGFEAVIDLSRPTLVEVEATGPVGKPASAIRVTSQAWVFPGRDVTGDGWVLNFPGLVIEADPATLNAAAPQVRAQVSLMCGCPIEPGGLWNADNYSVRAELWRGRKLISSGQLSYAGKTSHFAGTLPPAPAGRYRLRVTAIDLDTPNAGVWEDSVRVSPR